MPAPDSWAIKGGFALILRLGEQARATRDVDANWPATPASLEDVLSIVEAMDDGDWFTFDIGDARPLQGEGEDGAYRYAVTATLDGRVFEQLILDVNVVGEHDPRPVEVVTVSRNPFDFVDEPPLQVSMITPTTSSPRSRTPTPVATGANPAAGPVTCSTCSSSPSRFPCPTVPRSQPRPVRPSTCGLRPGHRSSTSRQTTGHSLGRPTSPVWAVSTSAEGSTCA